MQRDLGRNNNPNPRGSSVTSLIISDREVDFAGVMRRVEKRRRNQTGSSRGSWLG